MTAPPTPGPARARKERPVLCPNGHRVAALVYERGKQKRFTFRPSVRDVTLAEDWWEAACPYCGAVVRCAWRRAAA